MLYPDLKKKSRKSDYCATCHNLRNAFYAAKTPEELKESKEKL